MNRSKLPCIRLDAKPAGLKFRPPESAIARFDKSIRAAAATPAAGEIEILGEIGDSGWSSDFITASMVKDQLKALGRAPVLVTVNSPGGDAFEGIAIYNLLREHPGNITVNVIGLAASAASIIAMAGDTIKIGEAAFLMIHSAWGVVMGNENDMREMANVLDAIDQAVAGLYATRSGMPKGEVLALMQKETYMTGADAVASGFADIAVAEAKPKAARTQPIFALAPPALLAASGTTQRPAVRLSASLPGASGIHPKGKGTEMQTIAEQISSFESKRSASAARMEAIMATAATAGRSLDEPESQEYDGLSTEIDSVDAHLVRLKKHEAQILAKATPVPKQNDNPKAASDARAGREYITVRTNAEKGVNMARFVMAQIRAKGNLSNALSIVQNERRWMDTTPEVARVLMAAVAAGDTTTAGWASELVYAENLANEFIQLLRPQTVLGKIPGLRKVPFNIRMGSQTSGGTGYWVGQGKPIPVSKLSTGSLTLGMAKAAGLLVIDEELAQSSSPSAELLVRDDLIKTNATFIDVAFLDPGAAAVANVNPASITNGVNPTAASGTNTAAIIADVKTLFNTFIAANLDPSGAVWIMTASQALALSLIQNPLGQNQFPNITAMGGSWYGLPVITSQSAQMVGSPVAGEGQLIVLLNAPEILLADEGQMVISVSNEASIEMLDNPTNASTATITATSMVSMYQTNSLAIKGIRWINWAKRRSTAVAYIKDAAYVGG